LPLTHSIPCMGISPYISMARPCHKATANDEVEPALPSKSTKHNTYEQTNQPKGRK